jgi:hypothetical protein
MRRSREALRARLDANIQDLDDYERGVVTLVMVGYALTVVVVDASLVVVAARAIRRGWRQRQLGSARGTAAGLAPASGWAAGLVGAQVAAGVLARRLVDRRLAAHEASGGSSSGPAHLPVAPPTSP